MGTLNLYTTRFMDGGYELVWSISGDQGRSWLRKYIEIKSTGPFKVCFKTLKNMFLNFQYAFEVSF